MTELITARGRRPAYVAIAVGVLVAVALAAVVWRGTTTSFDTWFVEQSYRHFGSSTGVRRRGWLLFSEPAISFAVPAVVVLWAGVTRQARLAVFAVAGPLIALGVTELLGKPLIGRVIGPNVILFAGTPHEFVDAQRGSFPSGHETGAVSWLVVVVVIVFGRCGRRDVRIGTVVVAVLWALAAALGLTINNYHYATDTIGAIACATAVTLTVALLLDRYGDAAGARLRRQLT